MDSKRESQLIAQRLGILEKSRIKILEQEIDSLIERLKKEIDANYKDNKSWSGKYGYLY